MHHCFLQHLACHLFPNHSPQLYNLIIKISASRGEDVEMQLGEKLFLKALRHIFPFGLKVQSGISGAKGTNPNPNPSASPSPQRRCEQPSKSHHTGVSSTWPNTEHGPKPSILLLPKDLFSPFVLLSSPRGVPRHQPHSQL